MATPYRLIADAEREMSGPPIRIGDFVKITGLEGVAGGLTGHTGDVIMTDNLRAVATVHVMKRLKSLGRREFKIADLDHEVRPIEVPAPRVCKCCGSVLP